jgi:hypothetical protein
VRVTVRVDGRPTASVDGPKVFVSERPATVRFTAPVPAPAVGVCVVVTPDAVLGWTPTVELVTTTLTVQLPPCGRVIPPKDSAVAPFARLAGVVPAQVPPGAWTPAIDMLASVSVNAAPVSVANVFVRG